MCPKSRKDAASPGIKQRVIFQGHDRLRDGIERAAAGGEDFATSCQREAQSMMVWGSESAVDVLSGHRSRPAMHGQSKALAAGPVWFWRGHWRVFMHLLRQK